MRKLVLLAATALATTATGAFAQTVSYGGNTYSTGATIPTILYTGVNTPDAHGELGLTFTGTSIDGTTGDTIFNFTYSLENTSLASQVDGANISAFGFDVSGGVVDLATSFATTDGNPADGIDGVSTGNISGGNNKLTICATAGANCAGGSNGGPEAGETFTGTFGIEFSSLEGTGITLTSPIIRFQNTSPTGSDIGTPGGNPPVPEPATWAMMLVGFGAAGFALRRSRRKEFLLTQVA